MMMKALFSADYYSVDQSQTQWVKSVLEYHFSLAFELRVLCQGRRNWVLFDKLAIETSFQQKKEF